jgi:hypothetical protein
MHPHHGAKKEKAMKRNPQWKSLLASSLVTAALVLAGNAQAGLVPEPLGPDAAKKPNILVIWGDDIGQSNLSAYNAWALIGYKTPNIDRIAKEGILFTDYYGREQLHRRARDFHHRPVRRSGPA